MYRVFKEVAFNKHTKYGLWNHGLQIRITWTVSELVWTKTLAKVLTSTPCHGKCIFTLQVRTIPVFGSDRPYMVSLSA